MFWNKKSKIHVVIKKGKTMMIDNGKKIIILRTIFFFNNLKSCKKIFSETLI